jgi:hypothetical protein
VSDLKALAERMEADLVSGRDEDDWKSEAPSLVLELIAENERLERVIRDVTALANKLADRVITYLNTDVHGHAEWIKLSHDLRALGSTRQHEPGEGS